MTTINTTWGQIFKDTKLWLFNQAPELMNDLDPSGEDLSQWYQDDPDMEYPTEYYQWYLINPIDADWLEEFAPEIAKNIHYSSTLQEYIMGVTHVGTGWDYVPATLTVDDPDLATLYQKFYHDGLPEDVKRNALGEKDGH